MKIFVFLLFSIISFTTSYAQELPNFSSIKLENKEDYDSSANKAAWQAANYLLSTPIDNDNPTFKSAAKYMVSWMLGSPEFTFNIDKIATNISKENKDLMTMYFAAMIKYVLENKLAATDDNKVKLNAVKIVIQYTKEAKNDVKVKGELKKMTEADDKGKLAEYLKL